MALNFTLLTKDQIEKEEHYDAYGFPIREEDRRLSVIKAEKFGPRVAPSDLAVLLGSGMRSGCFNSEDQLTCSVWTASADSDEYVYRINWLGNAYGGRPTERKVSIRPVLSPKETKKITSTVEKDGIRGADIVEYGEYPQTIADAETSNSLEELLQSQSLHPTGRSYTFDSAGLQDYGTPFQPQKYAEYELNDKKYIRVLARPADDNSRLSNRDEVVEGKPYWVRVEPIEWLKDPSGFWVSKKCLIAGIQFDSEGHQHNCDFENTFLKHYLDTYFAQEIRLPEHEKIMRGLKTRLAEASDLDRARADTKPAKTPERTELAARMRRSRRERDAIREAALKAQEIGDEQLLNEIAEIAKAPIGRARSVVEKFHARQAARRAARAKSGRA